MGSNLNCDIEKLEKILRQNYYKQEKREVKLLLEKLNLLIMTNLKDLDFIQEESEHFYWKGDHGPLPLFLFH